MWCLLCNGHGHGHGHGHGDYCVRVQYCVCRKRNESETKRQLCFRKNYSPSSPRHSTACFQAAHHARARRPPCGPTIHRRVLAFSTRSRHNRLSRASRLSCAAKRSGGTGRFGRTHDTGVVATTSAECPVLRWTAHALRSSTARCSISQLELLTASPISATGLVASRPNRLAAARWGAQLR